MSIQVKNLTHIYSEGMPYQTIALEDISFEIANGSFVGIIGHTGSGKSTLIQHLNGLLKPNSGTILVDGLDITDASVSLRDIRQRIGLVFQYPEYQLFEETVFRDVCFGPKNLGLSEDEAALRARTALSTVGISEELYEKSPFEISGGQKRRVAIAGVLAMSPSILILDEPTAGLDPAGRDDILSSIKKLHAKEGITVILVSHNMEEIARSASRVIVMNRRRIAEDGSVREVFSRHEGLADMGLAAPQIGRLMLRLRELGAPIPPDIYTVEEARENLFRLIGDKNA